MDFAIKRAKRSLSAKSSSVHANTKLGFFGISSDCKHHKWKSFKKDTFYIVHSILNTFCNLVVSPFIFAPILPTYGPLSLATQQFKRPEQSVLPPPAFLSLAQRLRTDADGLCVCHRRRFLRLPEIDCVAGNGIE